MIGIVQGRYGPSPFEVSLADASNLLIRYMQSAPKRTAAPPEDLAQALAYALKFDEKRRLHHADDAMARIAVDHLVKHLEPAGL
jgi:hypothetical protein